ncbi:MAG TPA: SET domain-containing protein [Flavobacterium sp.]|nr:SET domain-containing protein [Flavobacterium sp.]
MIHPDTEVKFISDAVGYGVVAKKLIPKGTITWVQDELDRLYSIEEAERLSPQIKKHLETYCFTNGNGQKVLCWDNAKFVNHSFSPSCMSTAYDFEIAVRDILPGEELTDDYGYLNVEKAFEAEDEGHERKIVYPDDLLQFYKVWDQQVKDHLHLIGKVSQPLLPYLDENKWIEFQEVVSGKKELKSIIACYFDPVNQLKI